MDFDRKYGGYLIIQSNISSLYEAEAHTEEQAKKNIQDQTH